MNSASNNKIISKYNKERITENIKTKLALPAPEELHHPTDTSEKNIEEVDNPHTMVKRGEKYFKQLRQEEQHIPKSVMGEYVRQGDFPERTHTATEHTLEHPNYTDDDVREINGHMVFIPAEYQKEDKRKRLELLERLTDEYNRDHFKHAKSVLKEDYPIILGHSEDPTEDVNEAFSESLAHHVDKFGDPHIETFRDLLNPHDPNAYEMINHVEEKLPFKEHINRNSDELIKEYLKVLLMKMHADWLKSKDKDQDLQDYARKYVKKEHIPEVLKKHFIRGVDAIIKNGIVAPKTTAKLVARAPMNVMPSSKRVQYGNFESED